MCGISGIISRKNLTGDLKTAVRRMSAAQRHRGPDGAGEFFSDNTGLASRRLSIIDRAGGWQPLYSEDKSLALVFNGEIYNFVELRNRLKAKGHKFLTEADGEVILHLYRENPNDFVEHLRGMFAFALWDAQRRRTVLARDRMGEKPLYLCERDGLIIFASELKALLRSGLVTFEPDARAVDLYFHYQYVPEPLTAIKGVRKLDAGRMLFIDAADWRIEEKNFWRMEDAPALRGKPEDLIRASLEEVSELVVRSDVPVGVALSGGLDSSIVAAFAARHADLSAFSIGYEGRPESDERRDAQKLADFLKIPFFETELDTRTIVDSFSELNYRRDDPIADIAGFGYYQVMKLAREHNVPVVLQGQGGDELFWGYPQMHAAVGETLRKAAFLQSSFAQNVLRTAIFGLPRNFSKNEISRWLRDLGGLRSGWRSAGKNIKNPGEFVFYEKLADFVSAAEQMPALYASEFAEQIEEKNSYRFLDFSDKWNSVEIALTSAACATYLRENGIAQGDRLGMASSVEMRLPLVDYKFVETVIGLRKTQTDAELPPKTWLREAVRDVLPGWVLDRPKRGFAPPTGEWHRALFKEYGESLTEGFLVENKILSRAGGRLLAQGNFPAGINTPLSFKALVLEEWCRRMRSAAQENPLKI